MLEDDAEDTDVDQADDEEVVASIEEEPQIEEEQPRYPRRERNAPSRYTAGALLRTPTEDEPMALDALASEDAAKWKAAIGNDVRALRKLNCWTVVERPSNAKILHSKFVLKKKNDSRGEVVNSESNSSGKRMVRCAFFRRI